MAATNVVAPEKVEPEPQAPEAVKTVTVEDHAKAAKEAEVPQWALAGAMVGEGWAPGKALSKDELKDAVSKFMTGPLYREN